MKGRAAAGATLVALAGGCLLTTSLSGLTDGAGPADAAELPETAPVDGGWPSDAPQAVDDGSADARDEADAVVADGCVLAPDPALEAYYRFDEGQGSILHDCSGHGRTAQLTARDAGISWVAGHTGSAVSFNSAQETCAEISDVAFSPGPELTVTAWVQLSGATLGGGYIVGRRSQGVLGWRVAEESPTVITFQLGVPNPDGGNGSNDTASSAQLSLGVWYFVASVFKPGQSLRVSVNAGLPARSFATPAALLQDPSAGVRIGCKGNASTYFEGLIDEVRIYSRALSDSEIASLARL